MKQMIHIPSQSPQPRARGQNFRFLSVSTSCLLVAAGLVLAGCGDKKSAATMKPEDVVTINPNASTSEQQNQRIKLAVAIRDGVMPAEPVLKLKGGEPASPEVLAAYNQLLLRAMVERREPPETLQELQRWRLPKLPTPPAGKRIVYDAATCGIRLDPP
jgi:hypothetical protein